MVSWILSALLFTAVAGQDDCTVVYFGSNDCQPCQQLMPALSRLKQEGWDIRSVDVSRSPDLAQQYRIQNLPTLVIVNNQREIDRIVGTVSYDQLLGRFTRAAARGQSSPGSQLAQARQSQPTQPSYAAQQSQASLNTPSPAPLVRGQSAANGFPLLASNGPANPAADISRGAAPMNAGHSASANSPDASFALASATQPQSRIPQTQKPQLTVEQAIARAEAATVRIKVEEANTTAYGTGTIVDVHGSEALVLTCGHLFRDMKPGSQLSVDLFAGTEREVNVFAQLIDFKAEDEDIGLVSFHLPVAIEPVDILPRGEQLQIGQPAFSFGCDHGDDPTRRDTQIRNIDRYIGAANVEIVGAPAVGRSGGGLFDLQGRLIGVCNAADAQDDEGIYAAAEVVYTQIERLGMTHLFEKQPSGAGTMQLASQQREFPANEPANEPANQPAEQPASFGQPAVLAQPASGDWSAADDLLSMSSEAVSPASAQASAQPAEEIICIVRDAAGQSQVMRIAGPSPELLQTIRQNAR